jgi:hypothetical protein
MTIVTCPACGGILQPLEPSGSYPKQADTIAQAQLGLQLTGPQLLFPVGPLIVHHATVHNHLPLRRFLRSADIKGFRL